MPALRNRLSIILLTYNRADEVGRTLARLLALPDPPPIVVVDNASTDGTRSLVQQRFPSVKLVVMENNMGAAARNVGVQMVDTPYVAFCDDDSCWAEGSLEEAVALLDTYPSVAAVCARILLGQEEREDPICALMAASPLPSEGLPGPALLGFVACAVVFRRDAYLQAGGYDPKFFVGGEEELLTMDLVSDGWKVVYVPRLTVHHYPSPQRNVAERQYIVIRNALWVAWLRLPWRSALKETWRIARSAHSIRALRTGMLHALRELKWVRARRKVMPADVVRLHHMLRE